MLEEFAPGIWTLSAPLKLMGAEFGTRMTLVRVGGVGGIAGGEGDAGDTCDTGDGVILIAPCPIDDALEAEIRALGQIRALIAPNCFHHLSFLDATRRFPEAAAFLAEGVAKKLSQTLSAGTILGDEPDPIWKGDLEQCLIGGAPKVNEVAFFHAGSRTLILTDFCFNFNPAPKGRTGIFLRIGGVKGKLAVSRLMRSMLKDRRALRASLEKMLIWDFDRIVVSHGQNVQSGAKSLFRAATADL